MPLFDKRNGLRPVLSIAFSIAVLGGGFVGCSSEPPMGEPVHFDTGTAFEPFVLTDLEGRERRLSEFLEKSTLVSFFFPTCGACNEEIPHFQKFYEKYGDQGLQVVAVNVIPDQDELVPQWRDKIGITFPILVGADTNALIANYRLSSTPLNFVLDSQGKIVSRQEGYAPGSEASMEEDIRETLGL